ncbi:transposable element Tcb2 transposase [Trichonephila clavipes]|nr:transposable element Tcb2 transposase [Trichonephila clavipes]
MGAALTFLEAYDRHGDLLLDRIVTGDETWNIKYTTSVRLEKDHANTEPTTTDENHKRVRRATLLQIAVAAVAEWYRYRTVACFVTAINKCHRANHSTKHHRYGLSELKSHSCTLVDCTTQSFTLRLYRQQRHWAFDDWKHVAWYNESRFQLKRADGRVRVWRQPYESIDPTCQQGTVQAGGGSEIVWGVGSWRDMGPLIRLDTTLTDEKYVSILSDHLHPFMSIVHSDELAEFQQDNAKPLTFRIAMEGL